LPFCAIRFAASTKKFAFALSCEKIVLRFRKVQQNQIA